MKAPNPFTEALVRGESVVIGKVLAGTTVTKAMVDDMMLAAINGEAVHTYFDGTDIRMERIDLRAGVGENAQNGREMLTNTTDNATMLAEQKADHSGK